MKQYVINLSSAERKELRDLIDLVEKNSPAEPAPVVEKVDPAPTKTKSKAEEAEVEPTAE